MSLINKYHRYAFEKIRSAQPVVLLNGPSVQRIENHIQEIKDRNILYCAVNNRFSIEKGILHKINRKIDIWQINCTLEARRLSKEIIDFLSDKDSLLFLTTSEALSKIIDVLEFNKETIDFSKIFLLDSIHYNLCSTIDNLHTPAQWGKINALGFLICFFTLLDPEKNIYLFGCDGLDSKQQNKNVYYDEQYVRSIRKMGNVTTHGIYEDTLFYNTKWPDTITRYFSDRNLQIPKILNVNPDSFYTCFKTIDYPSAISQLKKLPPVKNTKELPNRDEHDDFYNYLEIILGIKNHNLHLSLARERIIADANIHKLNGTEK
ncbi:MAG: hypothetical protein HRT87_01725 [Legionellales bacterium]|nr:hypothetical protein [Legionellales bacterium]